MTDLSPAAQAVRTAYSEGCYLLMPGRRHQLDGMACPGLTAALRALADQVVPKEPHPGLSQFWDDDADQEWQQRRLFRSQILAIAAELEDQQ